MPADVFGELAGDTIVVVATGSDVDVQTASKLLTTLTPKTGNTNPPGGQTVPLSWTAVIQLAETYGAHWHAGPQLIDWMSAQVAARTAPPAALRVKPPKGMTPFPWQASGAAMIGTLGDALIFDDQDTGKTATTAEPSRVAGAALSRRPAVRHRGAHLDRVAHSPYIMGARVAAGSRHGAERSS
jgi:hypothetical protein